MFYVTCDFKCKLLVFPAPCAFPFYETSEIIKIMANFLFKKKEKKFVCDDT